MQLLLWLFILYRNGDDTTMATYELQPEEVVLYVGNVTCDVYKGELQLTLTSHKAVFEREKGWFKKEREIVDMIPIESVKHYNDAVQIR